MALVGADAGQDEAVGHDDRQIRQQAERPRWGPGSRHPHDGEPLEEGGEGDAGGADRIDRWQSLRYGRDSSNGATAPRAAPAMTVPPRTHSALRSSPPVPARATLATARRPANSSTTTPKIAHAVPVTRASSTEPRAAKYQVMRLTEQTTTARSSPNVMSRRRTGSRSRAQTRTRTAPRYRVMVTLLERCVGAPGPTRESTALLRTPPSRMSMMMPR
ncbi:hypothetical protein ACFPIJ_37860 [Dactylosporangium cerinum]|uniref:Uncharacterized protein n=1 Tax=Dactylosporangium cerinum TaxID=1434730 RepID=A0ABV9W774_9ACTN